MILYAKNQRGMYMVVQKSKTPTYEKIVLKTSTEIDFFHEIKYEIKRSTTTPSDNVFHTIIWRNNLTGMLASDDLSIIDVADFFGPPFRDIAKLVMDEEAKTRTHKSRQRVWLHVHICLFPFRVEFRQHLRAAREMSADDRLVLGRR